MAAVDLDPSLRRPTSIGAATRDHQRLLGQVAIDDNWQHDHPHPASISIADDLRAIHGLLSPSGHEFGYRLMYESLRFAALLGPWALTIGGRCSIASC